MSGSKQTMSSVHFKNPARIIGIQFGMMSPEEIRKGVVEVVSKDTYINNKEVPGGLFDPRMGVLGHGTVCPTDGLTHINTPGYFGYIELARPVFFIQHIKDIMSILKCVCFKCSKLLVSKEDHKHVTNMKASDRWDYVYNKCSGIRRCGEATESGCGCKQPDKIKLEEMATIIAIWDNLEKAEDATPEEIAAIRETGKSQFTMRFTAEIVLKIFKRISDEDVQFMGFSPIWSRPDWMVCQVLPVAPPSVRPSVKQDANQRSEDDLTHIYGHIIKTNKDLEDRMQNNAAPHVIDGLTKVLQYFVAMIANNKVKGAVPMAQRSGRPLQCITDRLNSKNGRIRGNLMGKRVDFSARSVITGDPNLSARQLGVPKKVAMNLTKPVVVNDRNRNFLTMLVQNGPDVYPGAKNYEKKNGDTISLRNRDRMSIRLENGDIVHRHMMDGDPVLFNRQPSLHRMSMMCHIAKIMQKGDTFRMNVCDTKPYNADFDGDEMNMHLPQNVLSETELRHLAAIPYQIISPSSNSPLIGIYQDSMLGTYRFTRPGVEFSPRDAMNILMGYSRVDVSKLAGKNKITNFDILSQITPPLTMKTKTKQYDDKIDDYATSNNVLEIFNGKYSRGQMIASTVKNVLNRICNDFGHMACSDYIDDLQQVITEYMKTSAYSVGVSDLISDRKTTEEILQVIAAKKTEVQQLTDKMHLGVFENKTGNNNATEYENQVKSILNKATDQTGAIAKKSLSATNRFLIMVASGSKGNMVNISQMISCLGQQSVDGKRVPYGFDSRTLPHFSKYDDSPGARGFVENSYISGLTAPELFFHAMGGRMGLIDTAVKSVTWETPIVLIDENGKPLYTEIGRWIDAKLDNNKNRVQHFDEKNMELLNVDSIYVPTTCEKGIVSWEEITAVTRHDPGTQLYEIKTLGGRTVTVTESKSLLIWDAAKNGFYEMLTPDIRVGDCVPVTMELPEPPVVIEKSEEDAITMATDFHKGKTENLPSEIIAYPRKFLISFFQILESLGMKECSYDARNEYNANILAMLYNRIGYKVSFNGCVITIHLPETDEYKNNVVLDPIVKINVIGVEKHPKMYDLTIPTTLNFGLANGLQVRDTSQTGYIQRRLVKGLEDLKVEYDMTVRNNMGKIVQFSYGEDSADPTRIENQSIPIVNMSVEDIYMHYDIIGLTEGEHDLIQIYTKGAATRVRKQRDEARSFCKKYIDYMLETRDQLVANVFKYKNEDSVKTPVAFYHLILNVQGQLGLNANSTVDITPLEAFQMIDAKYETLKLSSFCKPNKLFEVLYYYYLSPKDLLVNKRFSRKAIEILLESVHMNYNKSIISPGEMVGVIAGQSIGEPTTQMSLTRNECVKILKIKNGLTVVLTSTKIGDFCDQIISENPEQTFNTGYENSVETVLGSHDAEYYIMSVGENETVKWSKISHVSRHPVNGELMRVKTKSGRQVETTTSHSHLVRQNNTVQPIVGKDMKVGMRIPVSKYIRNIFTNESVKIGNDMFVLDELFGWFIGAYLAEGSINYNTICITNIADSFIQNTIEFALRFGKECRIYERDGEYGKSIDVKFTCKELADYLKITCGNGSFNKCVPDFAFVAPDEFKATLIQAYIDGDGNIQCDEKHHMIRACSRSLQLIKDIALLINYFGIFGSIHTTQTRGSELHHLSISAKYAQLYKTNIGSSLNSKTVALDELIEYLNRDDAHNVSDEIDKINGLGDIIAHCGKTLESEGQSRIYGRWGRDAEKSIGRRTLQKYISIFESSPNASYVAKELQILKQAANSDVVWDEIVEIDIWTPDQSDFVYDFTVPGNQTFLTDYGVYVHNTLNTFHLAGVASKSNVTRGVPRIEEILRLTRNPDKPSVTVYLRTQDQHDKDKATNYCNMLQHTKLIDVVKSVEICFDPNDHATKIHTDQSLIDQFYLFDKMAIECNDNYSVQQPRSKWIIRIEIDAESLLEKNITMDDIHFAVTTVHGSEVSCIYSDMNSSNLVFRIRLNSSVFNRGKKKTANAYLESLDQTDEIYLLKNFQDAILNNIVLRGVSRITNVNPRIVKDMVVKEDGKYMRKEAWVLDTTGSNLMDIFAIDYIDYTRTYSNDIREMYNVLGIEAVRQNILNEIVDVMEASDAYVNYHHLSILCDRMTVSKDLVPIYRSGILNDDIGPISKSTYEMHTEMFLQASRHGEFDQMRGVSANVMCGQQGYYGTNAFRLFLDMDAVMNMDERDIDRKDVNDRIEELFGAIGKNDECPTNRIRMNNNVHNLKVADTGVCADDGYDLF